MVFQEPGTQLNRLIETLSSCTSDGVFEAEPAPQHSLIKQGLLLRSIQTLGRRRFFLAHENVAGLSLELLTDSDLDQVGACMPCMADGWVREPQDGLQLIQHTPNQQSLESGDVVLLEGPRVYEVARVEGQRGDVAKLGCLMLYASEISTYRRE